MRTRHEVNTAVKSPIDIRVAGGDADRLYETARKVGRTYVIPLTSPRCAEKRSKCCPTT